MRNNIKGLFGDIPVTQPEIDEWMLKEAPNISKLRQANYIKQWNIADKIKAAKLRGEF